MSSSRARLALLLGGAVAVIVVIVILVVSSLGSKESGTAGSGPDPVQPSQARTTAVPVPSGGSIDQTVAPAPSAKTYSSDKTGNIEIPGEVRVKLVGVEKEKKPKAVGPGALNEPVAVVSLELSNGQSDPIDLTGVNVTLIYGKNRVGTPVQSELGKPFTGSLEPGKTVPGVYVFSVPKDSSDKYTILVQSGAGKGIAKFQT